MQLLPKQGTRSRVPEAETPEQHRADADTLRDGSAIDGTETVIGFDALYESMCKCAKGVMWKDGVASYVLHGIERTMKLEEALKTGTYHPRPLKQFEITYPKKRTISATAFTDRVYQRSLNDNVIYPALTRRFIRDNAACQKGKGTDFALDRLDAFLHDHYRHHGNEGFVLKIDIRGYYPNMRHDVARDVFRANLSPEFFRMADDVLANQYSGETGYEPGSQMIQLAGISVLDSLDHFIKERLRIKHYIRYMDDLILIHHDADYLLSCMEEIKERLADIGFEFNAKKTRMFPLSEGIRFLGFDFRLTGTGKVIRTLDPKNVKAERKRLRRQVAKCKRGGMSRRDVEDSYRCWKSHAEKGNTYLLLQRMDAYYKSLWEEETG